MRRAMATLKCLCFVLFMVGYQRVVAEPRSQRLEFTCSETQQHNSTIFAPNFLSTMDRLGQQVGISSFGVAVTGTGPDAVHGLAQCHGDLSLVDCVLCFTEARTLLPQCYPSNAGRVVLDGCFVRSANYSFFQEFSGPTDRAICGNNTRNSSIFEDSVRQAVSQAVVGAPSNQGFARRQLGIPGTNDSVYVLANCWRTLNTSTCSACLQNASANMLGCLPQSEARALKTGCFMRYSDRNFLNEEQGDGSSNGTVIIVVVSIVGSLVVLGVAGTIGYHVWKQIYIQRKREGSNDAGKLAKTLNNSSLNFKYSTLEKATGSFDEANKLGHGGFGSVYKGVLPDGRDIAVKRLFLNNRHRAADFYNEVNMISSIEHKNLVRLLGCSCSGPESLLVYEFLPNKSLDHFIFHPNKGKTLTWEKRYNIIVGTAEGLVYLHENLRSRIIHRDIKASNILLDARFHAKIADFGLARSFQDDKSHISTAVAGTLGYMAPEYLAHGQLTEKADVYSFGVLVLEIVTGKHSNHTEIAKDFDSLGIATWKKFLAGTVEELYDPNLMLHNHHDTNVMDDVSRVVHIGLLCSQEIPSLRPTMSKALQMLTTEEDLPPPTAPPFIDERSMKFNDGCDDPWCPLRSGTQDSIGTMSISSFYPR